MPASIQRNDTTAEIEGTSPETMHKPRHQQWQSAGATSPQSARSSERTVRFDVLSDKRTHEGIHPEDTHPVDTFAVKLDFIETTQSI